MNFGQSIKSGFSNYTVFRGRASRSEYWFWKIPILIGGIFTLIGSFCVFVVYALTGNILVPGSLISSIIILLLLSDIAISVRRLHDINRSGWWWLINLTVIGILLLIYWACIAGDKEQNKFGKNPLLEK